MSSVELSAHGERVTGHKLDQCARPVGSRPKRHGVIHAHVDALAVIKVARDNCAIGRALGKTNSPILLDLHGYGARSALDEPRLRS